MALTINLSPEVESQLENEAGLRGLNASEYVLQLIQTALPEGPKTGSDLVAYWQHEGLIGSRPDIIDSGANARMLRSKSETREPD